MLNMYKFIWMQDLNTYLLVCSWRFLVIEFSQHSFKYSTFLNLWTQQLIFFLKLNTINFFNTLKSLFKSKVQADLIFFCSYVHMYYVRLSNIINFKLSRCFFIHRWNNNWCMSQKIPLTLPRRNNLSRLKSHRRYPLRVCWIALNYRRSRGRYLLKRNGMCTQRWRYRNEPFKISILSRCYKLVLQLHSYSFWPYRQYVLWASKVSFKRD